MSSTSGLRSGNLLHELARPKYGPPCKCHGESSYWQTDKRCTRAGGYWRCAVRARERRKQDHKRHQNKRLDYARKYRNSKRPGLKRELAVAQRRVESLTESREMWKQRALAAEWGLKQHVRIMDKNKPHAGENGVKMRTQKNGDITLADLTVAA